MAEVLAEEKIVIVDNSGSRVVTLPKSWCEMCGITTKKDADILLVKTKFGLGIHICNKSYQIAKEQLDLEL